MLHAARRHLLHALSARTHVSPARRPRLALATGARSTSPGSSAGLFLAVFAIGVALCSLGAIVLESLAPAP